MKEPGYITAARAGSGRQGAGRQGAWGRRRGVEEEPLLLLIPKNVMKKREGKGYRRSLLHPAKESKSHFNPVPSEVSSDFSPARLTLVWSCWYFLPRRPSSMGSGWLSPLGRITPFPHFLPSLWGLCTSLQPFHFLPLCSQPSLGRISS